MTTRSRAVATVHRFWPKVNKTDGCWLWTGTTSAFGHGNIRRTGSNRPVGAHRFSYELHHGAIPDGLWVLHRCDNPRCVRPDHLFLGTPKDNMQDMASKGRSGGQIGEAHHHAKLTKLAVLAILGDKRPHAEIARDYNISSSYVCMIKQRRRWAHVVA